MGLDPQLVWKYYGEPDDWDPVSAWITVDDSREDTEVKHVKARDMFPYISPV